MSYFFLGALITPVRLDQKPELSWHEWKLLLEENLCAADRLQLERVVSYFDLENLQLYQRGKALTPFGHWSAADFEQQEPSMSEPWMAELLEEGGEFSYAQLQVAFFTHQLSKGGVAGSVLERLWHTLWISGYFRARLLEQPELMGREPGADHSSIEPLLLQLQRGEYDREYQNFRAIINGGSYGLEAAARAGLEWKVRYLGGLLDDEPFRLERLLVHLVQLAWVERWQSRHIPASWDPRATTLAALKEA